MAVREAIVARAEAFVHQLQCDERYFRGGHEDTSQMAFTRGSPFSHSANYRG